jgi:hypothetical protein
VFVVCSPPCIEGNETHKFLPESSIVKTVESVREKLEAKEHLRLEKARCYLLSYLFEVLGPHAGFPLRMGTNED